MEAARSFAGTFLSPVACQVFPRRDMEVLFCIKSDNRSSRFAGISSPLTDSNRRPPPYHGDFAARGAASRSRPTWCFAGSWKGLRATRRMLQPTRVALADPEPVPKMCPQTVHAMDDA